METDDGTEKKINVSQLFDTADFDTEVAANSAVNANTNKVTYPSADSTKVGYISVTQAVDLDTMETNIGTNNNKVGYTTSLVKSKLDADNVISGSGQIIEKLSGQNLSVAKLTANEVVTNIVSQSIAFATGSTIFGDEQTDVHQITGSLNITGSINFVTLDGGNF